MKPGIRMHLLIVDTDTERAAEVEGQLRHLGSAVHATRIDHVGALPADAPVFDLCVIALDGGASLAAAGLPRLREQGQHGPVLALGQPEFDCALGAILAHGFADWVGTDDPLHLREAARRELDAASTRWQTQQLRDALIDSERRLEVIMHNTRDAHAVVIDGVHANANNPYLRTLQLDPAQATATPFLDCVVEAERADTRVLLRAFGRGEAKDTRRPQTFLLPGGQTRELETRYAAWVGDGERGVLISLIRPVRQRGDALTRGTPTAPEAADVPLPQTPLADDAATAEAEEASAAAAGAADARAATADAVGDSARANADVDTRIPVAEARPAGGAAAELAGEPLTPSPVRPTRPRVPSSVGGLAAELDDTQLPVEAADSPATDARTATETATDRSADAEPTVATAGALRERLRQSIRQNTLVVRTASLIAIGGTRAEHHLHLSLMPGELLRPLADGDAVRRVAIRVGLAAALDRWQLFVASRLAARKAPRLGAARVRLHVTLCDSALQDETLGDWLKQLSGQYPALRHTLWLPLPAARRAPEDTARFRRTLEAVGMRLCLTDAFQNAGDLTDLRALRPHDVCLHSGVLTAWAAGRFSTDNVQRLTALLQSHEIQTLCAEPNAQLDEDAAARLGFCLIRPVEREDTVS
ncbi:MAG: EAL domain-containing protein [Pseudomonadota bacterium]